MAARRRSSGRHPLVDEVLAVGDSAFQAQRYDRISELRRNGTTLRRRRTVQDNE